MRGKRVGTWARLALVVLGIAGRSTAQVEPAQGQDQVPEAVARPFEQARDALDRKDWARADSLLQSVLEQAPDLRDAHFGRAVALAKMGRRQDAKAELDRFLGESPSVDELATAAAVMRGESRDASDPFALAYTQRALDAAIAQGYLASDDFNRLELVASLAFNVNRLDAFDRAVEGLERHYPNRADTHARLALKHAVHGNGPGVSAEIQRAATLGMPVAETEAFLRSAGVTLVRSSPWDYLRTYAIALAVASAGLVVLLLAGKVLSALTLRAAETGDPNLPITPQQRLLRRTYRLVINLAGLYYYICLPFVIVTALLIVAACVYLLLMLRRIPGKALVVVLGFALAMLAMIWASVKSLFVRIKDEDPGRKLDEAEAPGLWALAREVAAGAGTRPVDEIWLTDGTELGVFERGGWWRKLTGTSRRALILGTATLDGFRVRDFRAVLAHEYGHFLHGDTAGGDVAMRVNATMGRFAQAMAKQRNIEWWNIGWQFLRAYHYIFRRITHGASRLQEINADRVAARLCGKAAFEGGLRHVVRRDVAHGHELGQTARRIERLAAASDSAPAAEPWGEAYLRADLRRQVDQQFAEIWQRGTTEDDTHPSPVERIRLLSRLDAPDADELERGPRYVDDLFVDPAQSRAERLRRREELLTQYVARKRQQLTDILSQIDAYLREHPGLTEPLIQRGQVRLELRDFAAAQADFSEAIRLDGPNLALAYYGRGCARAELGDLDGAVADFREAMKRDASTSAHARIEIGDALFRAGRFAEAAEEYACLIAESPDPLNPLLRRADALAQGGDHAGAEADYDRALSLDPDCAEALAGRARARAALGKRDEATADARAALEIEPALTGDARLAELLAGEAAVAAVG